MKKYSLWYSSKDDTYLAVENFPAGVIKYARWEDTPMETVDKLEGHTLYDITWNGNDFGYALLVTTDNLEEMKLEVLLESW